MDLTLEEKAMLSGEQGKALRKAMEILVGLGTIYSAQRLIPVRSVQIAGVSYDNLGEAGLQFLSEMAAGGGRVRARATLNPAGMDIQNWQALGISPEFASRQVEVLEAFARMGVETTCSCTPYLVGNQPGFGEHIAWAESSAVCFANSVLGARTNREGGPSALAAALTGLTPEYGFHLDEYRCPAVSVQVQDWPASEAGDQPDRFGALGKAIGDRLQALGLRPVAYIRGIPRASLESLKSFCASLATYGGAALFHMEGITPEAGQLDSPQECFSILPGDVQAAVEELSDAALQDIDFVSLGCPHLSIKEIARLADLLRGQQVVKEFWITTARPVKELSDRLGYTRVIEASGAKFAADTCCVVAPIRGRFHGMATDSAKACYYAASKNRFKTAFLPFEEVVRVALGEGIG